MRQPIAGQTYSDTIVVRDSADTSLAKTAPAIDPVNDFLISINGGSWGTLDNAPTVAPAGSEFIQLVLSAAETTAAGAGGYILLRVADADASSGWIGAPYRYDVAAAAVSTLTAAQVNAEVDTALADYDAPTKAELDTAQSAIAAAIAALNNLSAEQVNAEVDAALADYDPPTKAELDIAQAAIIADTGAAETAILNAIAAAEVVPAGSAATPNVAGALTVVRGSTFTATLSGLSIPASWTKALFTVKRRGRTLQNDETAIVQIQKSTAGTGDGLLYLNGAASTANQASLTVNQGAGTVAVRIEDDASSALAPDTYDYDIKFYWGNSESGLPAPGALVVTATPTQTV